MANSTPATPSRQSCWLLVVLGLLTGASLSGSVDLPGVFFFDASAFELQTGRQGDAFDLAFQYPITRTGFSFVLPVAGDWEGDGLDSVGVYVFASKRFLLANQNGPGEASLRRRCGATGDSAWPVTGDWNGDGVDTVGVYDRATRRFLLCGEDASAAAELDFRFGFVDALPVAGDWDGDGIDTVGVYTPWDGTFYLRNTASSGPADSIVEFGSTDALPVAGDWDGDGVDTIGVLDPVGDELLLRDRNRPGPADRIVAARPTRWLWWPVAGRWEVPAEPETAPVSPWTESTPEAEGIDADQLAAAYAEARQSPSLWSLLVVRHDRLVGEEYFGGYPAGLGGNVKSVSKSVLSALAGIALGEGSFSSLGQTVASIAPDRFEDSVDPRKLGITLRHLLTMRSGLAWDESNLRPWFFSPDPSQYVIEQALVTDPGTSFLYSTGLTHLLGRLLETVTGEELLVYAERTLFAPLGVSVRRWDAERRGEPIAGAELYLTPRDMARFGNLYLRHGLLEGVRIVPEDWIEFSTGERVPPAEVPGGYGYGAGWWRYRFAGHPTYFAWGYGGQLVFVVEDLDLVVVVTADWTVDAATALAQAEGTFRLFADRLLPAVRPDDAAKVPTGTSPDCCPALPPR